MLISKEGYKFKIVNKLQTYRYPDLDWGSIKFKLYDNEDIRNGVVENLVIVRENVTNFVSWKSDFYFDLRMRHEVENVLFIVREKGDNKRYIVLARNVCSPECLHFYVKKKLFSDNMSDYFNFSAYQNHITIDTSPYCLGTKDESHRPMCEDCAVVYDSGLNIIDVLCTSNKVLANKYGGILDNPLNIENVEAFIGVSIVDSCRRTEEI